MANKRQRIRNRQAVLAERRVAAVRNTSLGPTVVARVELTIPLFEKLLRHEYGWKAGIQHCRLSDLAVYIPVGYQQYVMYVPVNPTESIRNEMEMLEL